jgi:MFS family permease
MTIHTKTDKPDYRWNYTVMLVGHALFGVAFTFVNPDSVLPAFAGQLTTSAPVIGLVGSTFRGGWMLPQLAVARLINDKPRKKPYLMIGLAGRIAFWVLALALWTGLGGYPAAMLALSFTCFTVFAILDGGSGLAWFDIMARAIPPRQRGRLLGVAQAASGLVGIGGGRLISLILDRRPFPNNYAWIFTLASILLGVSAIPLMLIREPPPSASDSESKKQITDGWLKPLLANAAFRRLMLCRLLVGMIMLATPFYVKHAGEALGLPESIVGDFVIAQTIAGVIASLLLGAVCERWGSQVVIRLAIAAATLGPLFALVAHLAGEGWLVRAYPFVYVTLGVINSAWIMGFFNYLLEIAPEDMRPAYVGLSNTIIGFMTLVPILGGWLLEATSYVLLFGLTTVLLGVGFLVSLGLTPPEHPTRP